jgi:N utilization substance protein B
VQGLYQMDLTGKGVLEVLAEFERFWIGQEIEGDQYKPAERGLFRTIVQGVSNIRSNSTARQTVS